MKKNILIGILSIISVLSMLFGLYQQTLKEDAEVKAIANEVKAMEMKREAEAARAIAEEQSKLAIANAMEAKKQQEIAMQQMQLALKNAELAKSQAVKAKH